MIAVILFLIVATLHTLLRQAMSTSGGSSGRGGAGGGTGGRLWW